MKALGFLFVVAISGSLIPAEAADNASLTIGFATGVLTVEGVSPGDKVVVFATSVERMHTQPALYSPVHRTEVLADDDRNGSVRINLPPDSVAGIWAVVDLKTGRYAISPTPGYAPERISLSEWLKNDNAGQLRKLQWYLSEMDVLLVRPGDGAWQLYAAKDSGRDENRGVRGPLRVDVASMTPVGFSGTAPHNFKPGDVLIVFHPTRLQYGALEVGK